MTQPKILIADQLSDRAVAVFQERGLVADVKIGLKPEELKAIISNYQALAVRSATKVTTDILKAANQLKVIGRAGIGVDNIDVAAATQSGVVVMNTPYGNSTTAAEHALAMMFALARKIPQADASTKQSKWEKNRFMGVELFAKTLGIIGCGNIGAIVADRALGLKMKVIAFDPYLTDERAQHMGIKKVDLNELLAVSDFITLHTPLTDDTRNILNAQTLKKTKPGVRIINCARGGLIDEDALAVFLKTGHVAGAALDVFVEEPAKNNPLFELDNVIVTPHLGASTEEAQENVAVQIAEQISDYLLSGAVRHSINVPSISELEAPKLKPYVSLIEKMAQFIAPQIVSGIKRIEIKYEGDASQLNHKPLLATALAALLKPILSDVNRVNAPIFAKERGIDVIETKVSECDDYHAIIRLTILTETGEKSISGTLLGYHKPRIIEINQIAIGADFSSSLIFIENEDVPGFIGAVGQTIGEAGINIATFNLGRHADKKMSIAVIAVDGRVDPKLLDKISKLPHVVSVYPILL